MIAVDTNLLVYAHRTELAESAPAQTALMTLIRGRATWAVPWPCVHEFLRVTTGSAALRPASPAAVALRSIREFVELPGCRLIGEGADHLQILEEILIESGVVGAKVHDARIAAICRSHGVSELWTADRDFGRFPWLRTRNPLVGTPG